MATWQPPQKKTNALCLQSRERRFRNEKSCRYRFQLPGRFSRNVLPQSSSSPRQWSMTRHRKLNGCNMFNKLANQFLTTKWPGKRSTILFMPIKKHTILWLAIPHPGRGSSPQKRTESDKYRARKLHARIFLLSRQWPPTGHHLNWLKRKWTIKLTL